jgi:hypothetical protein
MVHARVRTLCAILFVGLAAVLTACTPAEIAAFNTLDKPDQVKVIEAIQDQQEQAQIAYLTALHEHYVSIQMDPFLTCVRHHESDRGGFPHTNGYGAQNPYSTASGAYQFLDSTWRIVSSRSGHGGYPTAASAPWYVQDAVAHWTINSPVSLSGGRGNWNGTGC